LRPPRLVAGGAILVIIQRPIFLDPNALRAEHLFLGNEVEVGAIHLGKSLLPDEVRGAYPVEEWYFPAWSKTLVEILHHLKACTSDIAKTWRKQSSELGRTEEKQLKRTDSTDYSRMSYEDLRTIADNDSIAEEMSNEEYESLSVALWRKFSAEKLTLEPLDADAVKT
jgi:hypothetical protein